MIKGLKRKVLLIGLAGCGLLGLYLSSYTRMQDLEQRNQAMLERIEALKKENQELRHQRWRLKTDPVYRESIARQRFGLIKQNETVVRIKEVDLSND